MVVMAHGVSVSVLDGGGNNNIIINNNNKRKAEGKNIGSRRIFPAHFKLQVLDSYRNDSDCKGNQRATARKYGIHRRQIQKWLQVETNLRNCVGANNLNNNKIPKKPSSNGSKFEVLERNRQRDDAFPDAYSQSQIQARVPSISPDAYSENVPLDYTTSHDFNLTPIDLSVKKPNLRLNPELISPPVDQNIWDLSTTKRDTSTNKRKFEENPTTIITPKPVKLFKPYLDNLHDEEIKPLKPQNQEKPFNYQNLDMQTQKVIYRKIEPTQNYQTFNVCDTTKKTIDLQSRNLTYPEPQRFQNLDICDSGKNYQNLDMRDSKSPMRNYLVQIKSEQGLSLDLSPRNGESLKKNLCYQNLDASATPAYQSLEATKNISTYQNVSKSPSYHNLDLCEAKAYPAQIKSESNLSLDLSPRSYSREGSSRLSTEIKLENGYYERNYLESPNAYYDSRSSPNEVYKSPKSFNDDSTTKGLHNSPKVYHDDLRCSPKNYHDDVCYNKSPIPLEFQNKSHHDELQKSPILLEKSPLHSKSPKGYNHEDSCKSDESSARLDFHGKSPNGYLHDELRTSPKMFYDDLHGKHDAKTYINNNNEYAYPYAELPSAPYLYNPLTVDYHRPVSEDFYAKRGYSVDFKLSAVDTYYRDGSQKMAPAKYELHKRESPKWMKQDDELRQRNSVVG